MVQSQVVSITPATHANAHRHGGSDPLTGDVRVDYISGKGMVVPSDDLLHSNDPEKNVPNVSPLALIKKIELTSFTGGKLRIKFDMHGDGAGFCKGQIYRNGVAIGTLQTRNAGYLTYSQDIDGWIGSDDLELYAYKFNVGTVAAVRNLRIYGRIGDISGEYIYTNNDP